MKLMLSLIFFASAYLFAQNPTGSEILNKIDENMSSSNRIIISKMIINGRRGSRTIESKSWIEGEKRSFTEYLAPAREKGTKMLKLDNMLWMYSPSTDRTIQISGHMLRQSVMGSDLSYEDMMEDPKLINNYEATVTGTDKLQERECWVVELTSKTSEVAYAKRKLWVDRIRWIPLKEELYAKGGKLIKKIDLYDIVQVQNRWFPKRMIFKDILKEGDGTEFIVESIRFDTDIPDYTFSKAALRR